jgi:hypothetical protein
MSLVLLDRVRETTASTGIGTITLAGAVSGFQSFSVIGNNNTTYYTIAGTSQWEVGIGTYYGGTLTRDTVLSSSTGSKIDFSAGSKDVFVTYPAGKSVNEDANNRVLIPYTSGITDTGSLNVGSATLHTDSGVIAGFTASEPLYLYTSLQNTSAANTSYASYAVNDGLHTAYAELGINNSTYSYSAAGFPNNGFSTPLASFVESYGGPLVLGSWDNQKISMIINGAVSTTDAMTINTNGSVAFNGQVGSVGQVLQSNATSAPTWVTSASGTVTSVAATAGTGISVTGSPITTSGTLNITNTAPDQTVALTQGGTTTITGTYPNFTISSADQFQGTVTSVTGTAPVVSSGGATPAISMPAATTSVNGYLTSTDWTTFNNKGSGTVTSVGGTGTVNGITLTGTVTSSGNLTLGGTLDLSSPPIIGGTAPNTGNFSTVNLSAGTTTVAPLDFATGTNLTTPAAGAWEYDGKVFYATPIASNRAVAVIEHFVARTGTKTMTSNTALQAIFDNTTGTGGLTSGALTVGASTSYFFEMSINVSAMSATSGNMGFSIVGAGTATFTSAAWHAFGLDSTTQQTAAAAGTSWQSTAGATGNIVTAATGTAASAIVKGIFRINGAGTIIPSIQLTTASAAVIGVNTWFKCYPVGTNTVISVGNWA